MDIQIRVEKESDYEEVYIVNNLAFGRKEEAILTDNLRKSDKFVPELSLVACCNNKIIGYILFTKILFEKTPVHKSLALAPLSVHPQYQGKGVGSSLVNKGVEYARNLGYESIFVLGHKDYYSKLGFHETTNWNIKSPFGEESQEYFKAMELVKGSLDKVFGNLRYAKELL